MKSIGQVVDQKLSDQDKRLGDKLAKRDKSFNNRFDRLEKLIIQKHNEVVLGIGDIVEKLEEILGMPQIKKRIGQLEKTLHAWLQS